MRWKNVKVHPTAKLIRPELISIGEGTQIDDFALIYPGRKLEIGKYCHIASYVLIGGNGTCKIGDYVAITAGTKLFSATNIPDGALSVAHTSPLWMQKQYVGHIEIEDFAFVGANSVVLPDVKIGKGAIVGALSVVLRDIEPWSINVMRPVCKSDGSFSFRLTKIKDRLQEKKLYIENREKIEAI